MTHPPQPTPPHVPGPPPPPTGFITTTQPPAKKRRPLLWILGGITAVIVLCCSGVAVVGALAPDTDLAADTATSPTAAAAAAPEATTPPAPEPATPTPAASTAAPKPSPTAKPKTYKGRGDDVIDVGTITKLMIVKFSCPRCTGNTTLHSDGPENLLVNEIGSYTGKMWINVRDDSQTSQFEVGATGAWTLVVGTIDQLATKAPNGEASGKGDDVILLGGTATKARITHSKGRSNFVVYAYNLESGRGGLLVNEIGGYSGTKLLDAPALVQVTADGEWSIKPA